MTERTQVYRCPICGNIVEVLEAGAGTLVCCGKPMVQLVANTTDAATEKHVPVIEAIDGNRERYLYEASDLIYHLLVLNEQMGFTIADMEAELASRHK